MKKVLVLGNPLMAGDSSAVRIAKMLEQKGQGIKFRFLDSIEGIERFGKTPLIMDTVKKLEKPRMFYSLEQFEATKSVTGHDFDLYFALWLLQRTGKIKGFKILGVPEKCFERDLKKIESLLVEL